MTARIPLVINSGAIQELQSGDSFNLGTGASLVSPTITGTGTAVFSQVNLVGQGDVRFEDASGGQYVAFQAPATITTSYTLTWPDTDGNAGQALVTDGTGVLSWSTAAAGDVYGPASATDTAVALFDGTTGKLIKNSVVTVSATGDVAGVDDISMSGAITQSAATANGVGYFNGSKVLTSGSALTFDGTKLGVRQSSGNGYILVDSGTSSFASAFMQSTADGALFGTLNNFPSMFYVNGSEQMRLTSTGLGIGTSSPGAKLDVRGVVRALQDGSDSFVTPSFYQGNAANNEAFAWQQSAAGSTLNLWSYSSSGGTGWTNRLSVTASGNLGLGVTPSAWATLKGLQVGNASIAGFNNYAYLNSNAYYNGSAWTYISSGYAAKYDQVNSAHTWYTAPSGTAGNAISFTQAMTLDASGNVGIGTSSPYTTGGTTAKLSINGACRVNGYLGIDAGTYFSTPVGETMAFNVNSAERMRIDSSGNVGIGTSSATKKLVVSDSGAIGFEVSPNDAGSGDTRIFSFNRSTVAYTDLSVQGQVIKFSTGTGTSSTERMRIDSSGNVGIGTSTINNALMIYRGAAAAAYASFAGNASASPFLVGQDSSGLARLFANGANSITLWTNSTERMRIDSSGNVLVTGAGGLGYGTGSGGTVTQLTSKATTVTLNKPTGQITMNNAALAAATSVAFTVSNTLVAATDCVVVNLQSGAGSGLSYIVSVVGVSAGSFVIQVRNNSAGSLSEALVLNFAIIKGVTS